MSNLFLAEQIPWLASSGQTSSSSGQAREKRLTFQTMITSASPARIRCLATPNCGRFRLLAD